MKITPSNLIQWTLSCFVLFLSISCNKDSDLLAEYVVEENQISNEPNEVILDLENAVFTTEEDQPVSFNFLYNKSSKRIERRRYKRSSKPRYGEIIIKEDSIAIYTPSNDYNGSDEIEITLEVTNEDDTTSEVVVSVDVTVEPVTDVVEDIVEVTSEEPVIIEPLKNDTFKEESEVTITEVSVPSKGTAVINGDNTITYTPNTDNTSEVNPETETPKEDTFTYTTSVTNPDNTVTEETGTVKVTDKTTTSTEPTDMGELKAFPGAEGFGKNTTGGRGGKVIYVTNLKASGSGSLREALEASGARTIVFRVGGTIDMQGGIINIDNPNLTIAGESAPGDGILIREGTLAVSTSNVIIRHIRFRGSANGDDALRIKGGGSLYSFNLNNIIVDQCSFSWSSDENISVVNAKNVTIQNSILTGADKNILTWSNKDLSVINNILALSRSRNLECNQQLGTYLVFEEINNLVYGFDWAFGMGLGLMATIENNIFESSNSFNPATDYPISYTGINPSYTSTSNTADKTYVYAEGNSIDLAFVGVYNPSGNSWRKNTPLYRSTYSPKPIAGLKEGLLANAGAFPWKRDSVDKSLITNIKAKTGTLSFSGTFPTLSNGTPYPDSDGDGLDDNWELVNNLDSKDDSDGQKDRNGDGYTNLEEFLYSLTQK
ncbi:hypothetical protein KCTC52924_02932 [Arenibacter antarcticus]|uniref:Ig-like domain-containing protein n=1 Tax=Arenibacter antarcticus TaxID=2040469 RepID=A0ABW5VFV3_9FLAO|nr:Ig-like domain-containing protein [Arenibacter sp. H213]MCM4167349.1 hypothetical protein [Arenibacter sp. H213]